MVTKRTQPTPALRKIGERLRNTGVRIDVQAKPKLSAGIEVGNTAPKTEATKKVADVTVKATPRKGSILSRLYS